MEDEWKRPDVGQEFKPEQPSEPSFSSAAPEPTFHREEPRVHEQPKSTASEIPRTRVIQEEPKRPRLEPREEPKRSEQGNEGSSDKFWKTTTVVLIVLLAFFMFRAGTPTEVTGQAVAVPSAAPSPSAPAPAVVADVDIDDDVVLGDADAPVTIIEFSDYECPFCGRFYQQTLPELKSNYIDTGKVKLVFRDFPLSFHANAEPAAIAANCAGSQGKYYEYHDKIFENQQSLGDTGYRQWAEELGLDTAAWEECLKDPDMRAEVRKDFQDGQAAGVSGTPAFFVNGKLLSGAQPFSVFEQLIEAELS